MYILEDSDEVVLDTSHTGYSEPFPTLKFSGGVNQITLPVIVKTRNKTELKFWLTVQTFPDKNNNTKYDLQWREQINNV